MTTPVVVFFNNKGGVGKTSLAYHLACKLADLGLRVVAADLDPQANLTSMFLEPDRLEALWPEGEHPQTIHSAIQPLVAGTGDIVTPCPTIEVDENVFLIPGDLRLGLFEDELSQVWPDCLDRRQRAFRVVSAFHRLIRNAAKENEAEVAIVDVGPNLGAINRSALVASSHVVVPVAPDLFSLQGIENLGPTLKRWQSEWGDRLSRRPESLPASLDLPPVGMQPIGYVVLQHAVRLDRPTRAYGKWAARIPSTYARCVLDAATEVEVTDPNRDPNCLAMLRHYRSLMPLAQEAHKPVFRLKPADGALGSHMQGVLNADREFEALARQLLERIGLPLKGVER